MLARWLGLVALAAVVPGIVGCGGTPVAASETAGNQLTVYSSLPLQGETAPISQQIIGGEKLALARAGGHVGPFKVSYVSLDDANPANGQWSPGETAGNAKQAAQDTSTIAYLGDYDSGATAISLPNLMPPESFRSVLPAPTSGLTSRWMPGRMSRAAST